MKSQRKHELWSGCSGLERWASAFFVKEGVEADRWPAAFREIVRELPEGIRFL